MRIPSLRHIQEDFEILKRISVAIALLVVLVIAGSWIMLQETDDFQESVYRSMGLVTHIDVEESENVGYLYIISFTGFFLMVYICYILVKIVFMGRFQKSMEEGRKMKKIKFLRDHYIICGGGSLGGTIAKELKASKQRYIILEKDNETVEELNHRGLLAIEGDAFDEEFLDLVGIKKAKVLIASLNDDGDNLLVSLVAKSFNPKLKIVAEATNEKYVKAMRKAGIDEVVVPRSISGVRVAQTLLNK